MIQTVRFADSEPAKAGPLTKRYVPPRIYIVMRRLIILGLALLTSSCIRMGDGMFMVQGALVGLPNKEKCSLSLSLNNEESTPPWKTVEVSGYFHDGFTVSPYSSNYQIRISCNGKVVASKLVKYPQDMGIGGTLDLGKVNVQW